MRKTILLIEDDLEIIDIYTITLQDIAKFKIEAIRFGYESLEWIKKVKDGKVKKPDLVLLDLILPDMNGLDILKEMKKVKETKDIPVFILTNYSSSQLRTLGFKLGSEEYLTKTKYPPSKLITLIKEGLKKKKKGPD